MVVVCLLLAPGCNTEDEGTDLPAGVAGSGATVTYTPDQSKTCVTSATELLSLQEGPISGSIVSLDIVLTDCDSNLNVSGVAFELTYDDTVLDFLACSPGSFFPQNQLTAGTPACSELGGGRLIGTIGMDPPNLVVMGGVNGYSDVLRLTFNVTKRGSTSPVDFLSTGLDDITSTAVYFIGNNPFVTVHTLTASGYAGGDIVAN